MALDNLKRNLDGVFDTPKKATLGTSPPVNSGSITGTGGGELPSSSVDTNQSNPMTDAYQGLLMDSLKQAQGVDTTELLQRQRKLQREAISARTADAPEGFETMSPAQRKAIRDSNAGLIEAEIDENAFQLAKADKAIANYEKIFAKSLEFGEEFAEKMVMPESMINSYKIKIEANPDNMNTLLSTLNDKSKQAVINSLDFEKMSRISDEKDAVKKLRDSFKDAGITLDDSLLQAQAKLANSRIYQKQTRIASNKNITPETDNKQKIEDTLVSQVDSDGYLSPDDYNLAKQDWIQAGGTQVSFDKKFADRRNPSNANYDVSEKSSTKPELTDEEILIEYRDNDNGTRDGALEAGYDTEIIDKVFGKKDNLIDKIRSWF